MSMSEKRELYKDVAERNKKQSYESWLNAEGSRKDEDFADALSLHNAALKLSAPGYGALGRRLSENGLTRSGYADYIRNDARDKISAMSESAEHERYLDAYGDIKGYEKYVSEYKQRQGSIMSDVTELIYNKHVFDIETAFAIAMDAGLSEENALTVSAAATKEAKHKVREEAILYAKENKLSAREVRQYAQSLGLDEKSIAYILEKLALKNSSSDYYGSMTADQYLEYLKNKYGN